MAIAVYGRDDMEYQTAQKELVASYILEADPTFIQYLEGHELYGTATRVNSRVRYLQEYGLYSLAVYRPAEMVPGVEVGVRVLKKAHQGRWLYKFVFIPAPDNQDRWEGATILDGFTIEGTMDALVCEGIIQ